MNKESLNYLKSEVEKAGIETTKSLEDLDKYIMFKARKVIKTSYGMIENEIVIGWAKHFYMESEEMIKNEMGETETPKDNEETPIKKSTPDANDDKQLTIFDV